MNIRTPATPDDLLRTADVAASAFGPRDTPDWWRTTFHALSELYGLGIFLLGEEEGEAVSALLSIPTEVWLGGRLTTLGAVGAVSTHPDHRKHGYAGALMVAVTRKMKAEGTVLSALNPFSYAYYRKFGWEWVGSHHLHRFGPGALPQVPEGPELRAATLEDLPAIARLSDRFAQSRALGSRWTPEAIATLCEFSGVGPVAEGATSTGLLVVEDEGELSGFCTATKPEGDEALSTSRWFVALSDSARTRMLAGLFARGAREVEVALPTDDTFLLTAREQHSIATRCGNHYQFRVVNPAAALELLSPPEEARGTVTLRIADPCLELPVVVRAEWAAGRVSAIETTCDSPDLETDIGTFSQLYANALRPNDAATSGRLRGHEPAVRLAESLLPRWRAFRSPVEPG